MSPVETSPVEASTVEASGVENLPPDVEGRHHAYVGSEIPWYVRLIWLGFWVFAIYYVVTYLMPAIQLEFFRRP